MRNLISFFVFLITIVSSTFAQKVEKKDYKGLVINEFVINPGESDDNNGRVEQWIELYNGTKHLVDVSGLYLTTNPDSLKSSQIEDLGQDYAVLSPGQYAWISINAYRDKTVKCRLYATLDVRPWADELILSAVTDEDTVIIDRKKITRIGANESWVRIPNGKGPLKPSTIKTPGEMNPASENDIRFKGLTELVFYTGTNFNNSRGVVDDPSTPTNWRMGYQWGVALNKNYGYAFASYGIGYILKGYGSDYALNTTTPKGVINYTAKGFQRMHHIEFSGQYGLNPVNRWTVYLNSAMAVIYKGRNYYTAKSVFTPNDGGEPIEASEEYDQINTGELGIIDFWWGFGCNYILTSSYSVYARFNQDIFELADVLEGQNGISTNNTLELGIQATLARGKKYKQLKHLF